MHRLRRVRGGLSLRLHPEGCALTGRNPERVKWRRDLLLAAGILAVALTLELFFHLRKSQGAEVLVFVDGEEIARYALSQDTCVTIGDDEHYNTLEISDGSARVTAASCPDGLCRKQGSVHADGEMIVCLPNRLVVEVRGGAAEADQRAG